MIFGLTDLRIGGSEAKFDVQADGDVRFAAAPPKPHKNSGKLIFRSENFDEISFRCRKIKCWESREPCFAEVSWLCELCLGGKRPFKVCISSPYTAVYGRIRLVLKMCCFELKVVNLVLHGSVPNSFTTLDARELSSIACHSPSFLDYFRQQDLAHCHTYGR